MFQSWTAGMETGLSVCEEAVCIMTLQGVFVAMLLL